MKNTIIIAMMLFAGFWSSAQKNVISRVEPLNWWVGMHNPNLQIMVYGPNISANNVTINYPGVELKHVIKTANPNYLFLDVNISSTTLAGKMPIRFTVGKKTIATYEYELRNREQGSSNRQGFNSSDAIYLIMPDRFSNGDPANDNMPGMIEQANRKDLTGRHGGDLKGIINHLDYIRDLGMTAIWINPVQENNMPQTSFHGYAITDLYKIDPRLGTNEEYKQLVDSARAKGLKVIMDMVFNHCGSAHWWIKDLPSADWINQWEGFTRSNYRLSTISDPHVSQTDLKQATKGWFDTSMPDLNLQNPLLANYMIQNSIWWVEYAGLQGIRQDTYPYPDKHAMREWNLRVRQEYPNFNIVGESWITSPSKLAYWQKDFPSQDGYNSELPSVFDFPLMDAMRHAFNEKESWDDGLVRLYDILADDHLYPNPNNLVVFGENHDVGRLMNFLKNDVRKFKMAMAFLATTRGIPQLYYGSEILMMAEKTDHDGYLRYDFPGGWPGDSINAFTPQGRNDKQNDAWNYMAKVFNYRKNSSVLHTGKLIHFIPADEVYVYFRILDDQAVMVILNNAEETDKTIDTARYNEILKDYNSGKDVVSGKMISDLKNISIPAKSATIIELSK